MSEGRMTPYMIVEATPQRLFPSMAYEARWSTYEPGDRMGYGPTPEAAMVDLADE